MQVFRVCAPRSFPATWATPYYRLRCHRSQRLAIPTASTRSAGSSNARLLQRTVCHLEGIFQLPPSRCKAPPSKPATARELVPLVRPEMLTTLAHPGEQVVLNPDSGIQLRHATPSVEGTDKSRRPCYTVMLDARRRNPVGSCRQCNGKSKQAAIRSRLWRTRRRPGVGVGR
ncbi:hypothetical protein GQ53DRAFT_100038 [Thozetella sp. PMI_491]|nr:hypothetical protein GQ53DRAFT_100038 [Thozetella sp. PMI_491]